MFDSSDLGRLLGFWAACCQGVFSYLGLEIIGIAADETARQRETLPRAVRRVAYRSIFYHVGAVFVLGINVSADDPILKSFATESYSKGPFVLMAERAGLPGLGDWIKVVTLLALVSVANTRLYVNVWFHYLIIESSFVRSFDGKTGTPNLPNEGTAKCTDIQRSRFCYSGSFGICVGQNHIKECSSLLEDC